jgi:hypothetical protein
MKLKKAQLLFIIVLALMFGIVYNDKIIEGNRQRCYPINSIKGQALASGAVDAELGIVAQNLRNSNSNSGSAEAKAVKRLTQAVEQLGRAHDNDDDADDDKDYSWEAWKKYLLQSGGLGFILGIAGMYLVFIVSKLFWKMVENNLINTFDLPKKV